MYTPRRGVFSHITERAENLPRFGLACPDIDVGMDCRNISRPARLSTPPLRLCREMSNTLQWTKIAEIIFTGHVDAATFLAGGKGRTIFLLVV